MSADRWLGVEMRHLAALAAVVREGSFRGAASRLGYVQSAISQQVAYLERVVGVRLVERSRGVRQVKATEAGEVLVEHVQDILSRFNAAQADLTMMAEGESRRLRLGVHHSMASGMLPAVHVELARRLPNVRVKVTETLSEDDLFEHVDAGELDAAFAELPLGEGPFESTEVIWDPCVLLVPSDAPVGQHGRAPTPAQLAELDLVRYRRWRFLERLEDQLAGGGHNLRFTLECDTIHTAHALVGAGLGSALLPKTAIEHGDVGTRAIDLSEVLPAREVALFWHRDRQTAPTAVALRELARHLQTAGDRPAPQPNLVLVGQDAAADA